MDSHEEIENLWVQRTLLEKQGAVSKVLTPACVTQELQAQGSPETREAGLMLRHEI